jgi:N-acyl-D-amino-acid deacylase
MRLAKNLLTDRAAEEVHYYDTKKRTGRAISGPRIGSPVPLPYGVESLETMDANGGWIASAIDLVRFAAAFDVPSRCPILKDRSIRAMLARPAGPPGLDKHGQPKTAYYACGWQVRPVERRPGRVTKWHPGRLVGSETLLVCRSDQTNWAVLFNGDCTPDGKLFIDLIDPLLHGPADEITVWPRGNLFGKFYPSR